MYVLKKLRGISAVQTLSRLNRIYPPYNKKTFILDFVNKIEDIEKAFKPYYTTTLLCNTVTPELVYELDAKIDSYYLFSFEDAELANEYFYDENLIPSKRETKVTYLLSKVKKEFSRRNDLEKKEIYFTMRHFARFYEFLLNVSSFTDIDLHKKYNFIVWLLPYLRVGEPGVPFDLKGKIQATKFYQKKGKETKGGSLSGDPTVKLPNAEMFKLTEDEEQKLSDIIKAVNSKTGKSFDSDVALKAALQIRDLMMKNKDLIASAKSNSLNNFEFSYFSSVDDALLDGLQQNQEFFSMLLNDESLKQEVLGIFIKSIYEDLKQEQD